MIDVATLAATLVSSFLIPLIKQGAEGLGEELRTRTTEAAANGLVGTAKKLWQRIRGQVEDADDQEVVGLFERKPDMMKGPMEEVVRQLLERDAKFREEAAAMLESKEEGVTRWQLMGDIVGAVDARNADIKGGVVAGVVYGQDRTRKDSRQHSQEDN